MPACRHQEILAELTENFPDVSTWPVRGPSADIQAIVTAKTKLDFPKRLKFVLFLVCNGANPELVLALAQAKGATPEDTKSMRDIVDQINLSSIKPSKWFYYDIHHGCQWHVSYHLGKKSETEFDWAEWSVEQSRLAIADDLQRRKRLRLADDAFEEALGAFDIDSTIKLAAESELAAEAAAKAKQAAAEAAAKAKQAAEEAAAKAKQAAEEEEDDRLEKMLMLVDMDECV